MDRFGIGQGLLEHAVRDRKSGHFLTATFQDCCLRRAACAPPPAIVSAVCDALGMAHTSMPVTAEKPWRVPAARLARAAA